MKKIQYHLLAVLLLLSAASCENEKYLFGEGPDERLSAILTEYQNTLCEAPHGWFIAVGTQDRGTAGGAYRFWAKFSPNNRITMYGDINTTTATTEKESSYRLKAMQLPTLMFDGYNYIHWPADPRPVITGATTGDGLLSDYDVNLVGDLQGDEFKATGRLHNCPFIFTKATAEEQQAVTNASGLTAIQSTVENFWNTLKYPTIDIDEFRLQLSIGKRLSAFNYIDDDGNVQTITIPSYPEFNRDIRLTEPFEYKNIWFDRIHWNGNGYEITTNNHTYPVYEFEVPFYPLEFGVGKMYNTLTIDKTALNTPAGNSMIDPFLSIYEAAEAGLHTSSTRDLDRLLIIFELSDQGIEQMRLRVMYHSGTTNYLGEGTFKLNRDNDGYIYFTDFAIASGTVGSNMNGTNTGPKMATNILSYLLHSGLSTVGASAIIIPPSENKFRIDWAPNNTPGLSGNLGGFYVVNNPASYIPGTLSN
ncbi:MAG: DUF4302 domain-containing protein [Prevotellaceae bacterium]|jgi:hypothetical protein|nr:DUF4302 domain-containing protein [Prevotellaceae bacterium]